MNHKKAGRYIIACEFVCLLAKHLMNQLMDFC